MAKSIALTTLCVQSVHSYRLWFVVQGGLRQGSLGRAAGVGASALAGRRRRRLPLEWHGALHSEHSSSPLHAAPRCRALLNFQCCIVVIPCMHPVWVPDHLFSTDPLPQHFCVPALLHRRCSPLRGCTSSAATLWTQHAAHTSRLAIRGRFVRLSSRRFTLAVAASDSGSGGSEEIRS